MPTEATRLETMLRRDRNVVVAGLAAVALLAWAYLFHVTWSMGADHGMRGMEMAAGMAMPQMRGWGTVELLLLLVMWAVMMVAMMVPRSLHSF